MARYLRITLCLPRIVQAGVAREGLNLVTVLRSATMHCHSRGADRPRPQGRKPTAFFEEWSRLIASGRPA